MKFILGKKIEMTQIFDEKGNMIPLTLIEAGPCYITQVKKSEKDKYEAVQMGFEKLKDKKVKKTSRTKPYRFIKEFKGDIDYSKYSEGDKIDVSVFSEGDNVKISGISKGKGFAGGVKRHGFGGKPATHGMKHEENTVGSIGPSYPQRVIKGRRMPGHMGVERVSVKNVKIIKIDLENNLLAVKGAVPGRRGTLLEIRA